MLGFLFICILCLFLIGAPIFVALDTFDYA